jgi:hypothetical protein
MLAGCEARFAKIETDLAVIKWMLGIVIAGVASLVIKTFA